jgi:hypothetical protein
MTYMGLLSLKEFERAIVGLNLEARTLEIAKGVLVNGKSQVEFCKSMSLTRGAISQAVKKVSAAHKLKQSGEELVSVVLPEHQAYIVKQWAKTHAEKGKKK